MFCLCVPSNRRNVNMAPFPQTCCWIWATTWLLIWCSSTIPYVPSTGVDLDCTVLKKQSRFPHCWGEKGEEPGTQKPQEREQRGPYNRNELDWHNLRRDRECSWNKERENRCHGTVPGTQTCPSQSAPHTSLHGMQTPGKSYIRNQKEAPFPSTT